MELRRQYWDSSVFCSFLNKEENRYETVSNLLKEARAGRLEIVTSSFALVEVLKIDGSKPITDKQEDDLKKFFEFPFIKLIVPDREICERARFYFWRHKFAPKDALHMATAERAGKISQIHELFSWDGDFYNKNGTTPVNIPISQPFVRQPLLNLPEHEDTIEADDTPAPTILPED